MNEFIKEQFEKIDNKYSDNIKYYRIKKITTNILYNYKFVTMWVIFLLIFVVGKNYLITINGQAQSSLSMGVTYIASSILLLLLGIKLFIQSLKRIFSHGTTGAIKDFEDRNSKE